jgi:hypothetical protein
MKILFSSLDTKELGRKRSYFVSRYCLGIHLEGLRKNMEASIEYCATRPRFEPYSHRMKVRRVIT